MSKLKIKPQKLYETTCVMYNIVISRIYDIIYTYIQWSELSEKFYFKSLERIAFITVG